MAEKYDKNGYNSSDFKRNSAHEQNQDSEPQNGEDGSKLNEKAGEYMRELLSEKIKLNSAKFPISISLIDQEVAKVQASGRVPLNDNKYLDIHRDKPIKLIVKVLVPIKEFPKFNFIGKILGPKGNTMKQLQEETMCKMAVLGRGSMRDRQKEEELRNSLDPKYAHLMDDLHVEISALAAPTEAHARIAYALAEVKKYLTPDPTEILWHTQHREMDRGVRAGPPPPPRGPPPATMSHAPHASHYRSMPAKTKVISILERARSALESSYPYEDPYAVAPEPPIRGTGRGLPEPEAYYERSQHERFYEDDAYDYKPHEYKSVRDVGSRRAPTQARQYARASPYGRPPKYVTHTTHSLQ